MRYPATVNLPFNHDSVSGRFVAIPQGADPPEDDGYWALLQGNSLLVREEQPGILTLPFGRLPSDVIPAAAPLCIGLYNGHPLRIAAISRTTALPDGWLAEPFNAAGDRLDDATLTLGGMAMQILNWQKKSCCCPMCGSKLTPLHGSWGKLCPPCNYEHFPAVHPCAIILVRRDDSFLLVRKPEWQQGRYGLVAGFLDMGESLEECAAREVLEETGIRVKNISYVGSQCWPFPSQLMAGFVADYDGGDIVVDRSELEDAMWWPHDRLPPALPPQRSIARWIIDRYARIK